MRHNPETSETLPSYAIFLLRYNGLLYNTSEIVWKIVVARYKKKYKNNPQISALIDVNTRGSILEHSHIFSMHNKPDKKE